MWPLKDFRTIGKYMVARMCIYPQVHVDKVREKEHEIRGLALLYIHMAIEMNKIIM